MTDFEFNQEPDSSFYGLNDEDIETHLRITRYSSFELTGAVAPSYDVEVKPEAGFQFINYSSSPDAIPAPGILASVSKPDLLDVFQDLLSIPAQNGAPDALYDVIIVYSLRSEEDPDRFIREQIELPELINAVESFSSLLLQDGYLEISVVCRDLDWRLTLDDHKLIFVLNEFLKPSYELLRSYGIPFIQPDADFKTISDAEHLHVSSDELLEEFERLCITLRLEYRG